MASQIDLTAIALENLARALDRAPYPPRDEDEARWMRSVENAFADLRDELIDLGVDIR